MAPHFAARSFCRILHRKLWNASKSSSLKASQRGDKMSEAQPAAVERRREKRVQVRLPVAIRGKDRRRAHFDDLTTSENLCRGGVAFALSRDLDLGTNPEITIP